MQDQRLERGELEERGGQGRERVLLAGPVQLQLRACGRGPQRALHALLARPVRQPLQRACGTNG